MTELLVGTKKGLFVLEGAAGSEKPVEEVRRALPAGTPHRSAAPCQSRRIGWLGRARAKPIRGFMPS